MASYWSHRIRTAMDDSRKAPTCEIRDVYLQIIEHYKAMEKLRALPSLTAQTARVQLWAPGPPEGERCNREIP